MLIRYLRNTLFVCVLLCMSSMLMPAIAQEHTSVIEISLLPTGDDTFALIDDFIKEPFLLEQLNSDADVVLSREEMRSLINLTEGQTVTAQNLKKACWHLKCKNKFDRVELSIVQGARGKSLTFSLKARWTFSKIQFKGSFVEKERLEQHYFLAPGEEFTLDKHQLSLEKIIQELHNSGYLNANVRDYIAYDKTTKTVSVTLSLDKTDRFSVDSITCSIMLHEAITATESEQLKSKIVNRVAEVLQGHYFDKAVAENQIELIKRYLARKGFFSPDVQLDVTVDKEQKLIHVNVAIRLCHKKRFVFFGNHFFSTESLLNEMVMIGGSTLLIPPALLAEDIVEFYKKKGFWQAQVEWKEEPGRFFFLIKEGPQMRVSQVEIEGDTSVATPDLIKKVFKEFCASSYYDAQQLAQALDKLALLYRQEGYWDFLVVKKKFEPLSDTVHKLIVTVSPGTQRKLVSVTIENFPQLEETDFFSQWKNLKEPICFNLYSMQEQRHWLLKYFRQKGFIYSKIYPELITDSLGIRLIWHIDTEPGQICFGKTVIEGTSKLAFPTLMRELTYKEGDLFDKEKIAQTVKRLKSLGIFESVSLAPYDLGSVEPSKTMILKFVEDYPYEIRTRFGFQQVSKNLTRHGGTTYKAGGSFLWKNPFGQGDFLRFDADITRYTRHASGQYEFPWLWSQPIRGIFKAYSSIIEQPIVVGCHERLYKVSQDGFLSNFRRAFDDGQTELTCGLEWMKISGLSHELAQKIHYEPHLVNKRSPYVVIEPSIVLDYLDNQLNPTKGAYTFASAKGMWALNVEKGSFLKLLLEQSFFTPIFPWAIGGLRFRFGHIINERFSTIMPTERFYLGGSNSLRGYEPDMAPPLNSFIGINNERFWVPIGGKSMININAEIRIPLYKQLSGVVFSDMGALAEDAWFPLKEQIHWVGATGFGVRYDTPISPIRFDIGWKWKKRHNDDRRYAWFLTLGHAF